MVQKSRLMMSHMNQKGMKRFSTHIVRFSGEIRIGSLAGPKHYLGKSGGAAVLGFYSG